MSIISKEAIFSHLESVEEFPIALSDVWEWLGYSKKENALQSFRNLEMAESIDFIQLLIEKHRSIKPLTEIKMTIDCFKLWAMSAQTAKGKEVRLYYLQIEKEWKAQKSAIPQISADHVKAFIFQDDVFSPWAADYPTAAAIFMGWQGVAAPVQVIQPASLNPSTESQKALDGAFLNLNRSGLMMNKLFHFLDRIPTMKALDENFVNEMVSALSESERVRISIESELEGVLHRMRKLKADHEKATKELRSNAIELEAMHRRCDGCNMATPVDSIVCKGSSPKFLKSAN